MRWLHQKICEIDQKKSLFIAGAGIALFIFLILGKLQLKKSFVICVLFMTILFWTTDAAPKWLASLFLLSAFAIVRAAPLSQLFKFPLSQNFFLIAFSYLFAEGIKRSRLFHVALPCIRKYVHGIRSLAVSILLCCTAAIWIIPQPYTRVVILLQLYRIYFESLKLSERCKKILCLWIVNTSMFLNAAFFKGDIILNSVLIEVSGHRINELIWSKWMLIPTIMYTLIGMTLFYYVFFRELSEFQVTQAFWGKEAVETDKAAALIVSCTVLFWLLEPMLHIPPLAVLFIAVAAMAWRGIITIHDIKSVNPGLLMFLTASFSIGPVMNYCGVAGNALSSLTHFIPDTISYQFMLVLMCICMLLHMILGSCVTALSVAVPGVLALISGTEYVCPILFIIFTGCVTHYILCIHNVLLAVGMGIGGYSDIETRRYGKRLTLCVVLLAIPVYMTYWSAAHLY